LEGNPTLYGTAGRTLVRSIRRDVRGPGRSFLNTVGKGGGGERMKKKCVRRLHEDSGDDVF